jgi:hypothetical protein
MAERGWTAQVAAAAGVAAGTGAAQLGLGYGLGVVEWPALPAAESVWLGSLGWATWISANATVFGAVIAGRLGRTVDGPWRFALAASAAVGALLTVALIALPARAAVRTDTFSPQTIAAGYAVIGVLLGLVIAYWAVVSRPVAANLIATAAWLWSLAVAAVMTTVFWHHPSETYLSSWQFVSPDTPAARYGTISWPSALLTLLAALVIGVIGALPSVRRGDLGVGAASSGAVGPLLVAAAFFVLAPQLSGTPGPLQSAYLIAPYAVLAGLAGSALTVALGQRQAARIGAGVSPGSDADRGGPGSKAAGAGAVSATVGASRSGGAGTRNSESGDAAGSGAVSAKVRGVKPASRGPAAGAVSAAAEAAPAGSGADSKSRPRRSLMDRFRRKDAGQSAGVAGGGQSATATGRAKAPAPTPVADANQNGSSSAGASAATGKVQTSSGRSGGVRGGSARSGAASVDGAARPAASSAPGRSDSRSTVSPPPASPPIAKINAAQSGDKVPAPRQSRARPSTNPSPGPADAASSDKTPPPRKTAAKSTKATPPAARSDAPKQANTAGKDSTLWSDDADTAELPVQDPKRRRPADES